MIRQHFQHKLQHQHKVCEAGAKELHAAALTTVPTPSWGSAGRRTRGDTALLMWIRSGTLQPKRTTEPYTSSKGLVN